MPDLTKLSVPEHQANQPYHWTYDNLPLKTLAERDEVINNALDRQTQIINAAGGTQGNLANRLNQSLDENGNLKSSAIDESLHNIGLHEDGLKTVTQAELDYYVETLGYSEVFNPVSFVRMLESERDKLAFIPKDATNLKLEFCLDEGCVSSETFDTGIIRFERSSLISWEVGANRVRPVLDTSVQGAHQHFYDIEPLYSEEDNIYIASGTTTLVPYIEGSLRVYINGIRLTAVDSSFGSSNEVFYPSDAENTDWVSASSLLKGGSNKFTPNHEEGTFALINPISDQDVIRVDFDRPLI